MSSAAVYVKSNSDSDDNAIYIYGGFNLSSILSEFLFYDFEQNQWRPVNVATHNGLNPPPLMGHTLTAVTVNGNYELVMIGGRSGEFPNNHSREIYYFNTGKFTTAKLLYLVCINHEPSTVFRRPNLASSASERSRCCLAHC